MENSHEAWRKFKEWCKEKYGSTLVDAYTAFFWLIDPEYCIADQQKQKTKAERIADLTSAVLDDINKASPSDLSKNGFSMLLHAVNEIDSICKENGGA